jgi:hypothetical protein
MKKAFCMIALAAKTKMKHGNLKQKSKSPNKKVKTKVKDTTKH